jgi:hypothetical protein
VGALAKVLTNLWPLEPVAIWALLVWRLMLRALEIRLLHRLTCLFLPLLLPVLTSCSTLSRPLPPVNLSEPGWTVRQGQAVWTLPRGQKDIAGEVILATGPADKAFVQFSKSPFTLVVGQLDAKHWQVEFPPQNKHYAGPGTPPKRIIWLYLPRVLAGKSPPRGWSWSESEGNWRLQNPENGEAIEGFFAQ